MHSRARTLELFVPSWIWISGSDKGFSYRFTPATYLSGKWNSRKAKTEGTTTTYHPTKGSTVPSELNLITTTIMLSRALLATAAAALLTPTLAQTPQRAIITITTSHGGAGQDLTNRTITIPLNDAYTNADALEAVSYLSLTGATGVPFDSVTCQAYQDRDATMAGGEPFDSSAPALLSTNTVVVGSIVCTTDWLAMAPGDGNYSTSILATATSSGGEGGSNLSTTARPTRTASPTVTRGSGPVTSVYVTTMSATNGGSGEQQSTVTSVVVPSESAAPTEEQGGQQGQESGSATSSASAGLSTGNAAAGSMREIGGRAEVWGVLAVLGAGVAFMV